MRTTLDIDEELLDEVCRVAGFKTKTAAIEAGLRALLAEHSRLGLAALHGKVKEASAPYRRRGETSR
jgi:Arc/MetJ family transcription regulator